MSNPTRFVALALAAALLGACSDGGEETLRNVAPEPDPGVDPGVDPDPPRDLDFEYIELPEPRGLLPDIALADSEFESVHHSGSGNCASCHNNEEMKVPDEAGGSRDLSIEKAWRTSVMANSARDPYWHAVVAYELDEFPSLDGAINDKCTVCHAPMASDYAKKEGLELRLFDKVDEFGTVTAQGIYDAEAGDPLFDHAMDGVSCSLCHQVADNGILGQEDSFTGGYFIADARGLDARPAYGQYGDPAKPDEAPLQAPYMQAQSGYKAQYGAHMSESTMCATCHELNVDPVDDEGSPLGGDHFAEQSNYTEWRLSDYGPNGDPALQQSCQDCHMPVVDRPVPLGEGSQVARAGFAEHTFLGANTVMQTMFRDFAEQLGIPAGMESDFDESIERNRAFLETSATLELGNIGRAALPPPAGSDVDEPGAAPLDAGPMEELAFDVKVINETGHRLPSGYHSRRVYLHVVVTDEDGKEVFESGRIEPDGRILGVAEDVNADAWEPHHDVITRSSQVQVWQAIVGRTDGTRTHSLLSGDRYLKDNRILPKGFFKAEAIDNPETVDNFGTFGKALTDDDFDSGLDTVSYRIAVPASGNYTVLAELRYQPLAYGHLQELFQESADIDAIDRFRTIYDRTWRDNGERLDEVIATTTADLP